MTTKRINVAPRDLRRPGFADCFLTTDTAGNHQYELKGRWATKSFVQNSGGSGNVGTVTSVALTVPAQFNVGGSPITTAGTLAITWATESANLVLAGPTTGAAAAPTFRSLVTADLPATAVTPGSYTNTNLTVDQTGRITAASNGSGGSGTVTSVGLALDSGLYTVSGSPVTSSGTLTGTLNTQTANFVYAGPTTGSAAKPSFRAIVAADLPLFSSSANGAVGASGGGTVNFLRADGSWATPPGTGTVTTTGSPASGNLTKFSGSTSITNADLTGDVTTSGTVATTLKAVGTAGIYGDATHVPQITTDSAGRVSAVTAVAITQPTGANPSATAGSVAVNGSSANFMRADAAPAVQVCNNTTLGLARGDGSTITQISGVLTAVGFAPSGAAFHPGFQSGRYYGSTVAGSSTNTFTLVANTLYAHLFYVPASTTFTKVGIHVSSLIAGKHVELGVYANSNGVPAALLFDLGEVSTAATGDITLTGLSYTLAAGWYWLVCASDGTPQLNAWSAQQPLGQQMLGQTVFTTQFSMVTGSWVFSTGALPNPFPTLTYVSSNVPQVFLGL